MSPLAAEEINLFSQGLWSSISLPLQRCSGLRPSYWGIYGGVFHIYGGVFHIHGGVFYIYGDVKSLYRAKIGDERKADAPQK